MLLKVQWCTRHGSEAQLWPSVVQQQAARQISRHLGAAEV